MLDTDEIMARLRPKLKPLYEELFNALKDHAIRTAIEAARNARRELGIHGDGVDEEEEPEQTPTCEQQQSELPSTSSVGRGVGRGKWKNTTDYPVPEEPRNLLIPKVERKDAEVLKVGNKTSDETDKAGVCNGEMDPSPEGPRTSTPVSTSGPTPRMIITPTPTPKTGKPHSGVPRRETPPTSLYRGRALYAGNNPGSERGMPSNTYGSRKMERLTRNMVVSQMVSNDWCEDEDSADSDEKKKSQQRINTPKYFKSTE